MDSEQASGTEQFRQTEALLSAAMAFAVCGDALTREDLSGPGRLERLMEAQGALMAAAGPGHRVRFTDLLERLTGAEAGSMTGLMPEWADPGSLDGLRFLDVDGVAPGDAFDFRLEAERVIRAAKKVGRFAGRVTFTALDDEHSQESVFSAIKGPYYERHRTNLIEHPVVLEKETATAVSDRPALADLELPTRAIDFYRPVPQHARYRGWWFPCPACRWPMKVSLARADGREQGRAWCLYPWHEQTGATYLFQPSEAEPPVLHPVFECHVPQGRQGELWTGCVPEVPQAQPVEGHKALVRSVWRSTCVPGLPELRLHRVLNHHLKGTGWRAELWVDGDRIDLHVANDNGPRRKTAFPADFKDYTFVNHLVDKLDMDAGDKGDAKWLVVPDHRDEQVQTLDPVCRRYGMRAITASGFVDEVLASVREGRA
ncbi:MULTISPECIES: restriction endonuclease-related protein [Streptomycetaceae]|nr:hypothetical protein [Streptantibioticus cattleyicolor]CCB76548.1 Predicted protein [Streptantibioticus cattleyicolor NRRL 8057 = DSM 46488]